MLVFCLFFFLKVYSNRTKYTFMTQRKCLFFSVYLCETEAKMKVFVFVFLEQTKIVLIFIGQAQHVFIDYGDIPSRILELNLL